MKKIISLFAVASIAAVAFAHDGHFPFDTVTDPSVSHLKVSTSVSFESEYVYRGVKYGDFCVQPAVEISYPIAGFDVYAGAWMNAPLEGPAADDLQEIDFNVGASYAYSFVTFDAGYSYYWYPSNYVPETNREHEFYFGVSVDTASFLGGVNINPSIYYFYNLSYKASIIEASLSYDFKIGEYVGLEALSLPVRAYYGWYTSDQFEGDQDKENADLKAEYMYYGATADIAYALTEYCTLSVGIRFAQNFDRKENAKGNLGKEKHLWYGVKADFSF